MSLHFEQLENKIALSTLSHAVYRGNNNPVVKPPIYHRTKIDPIHIPKVPSPINSMPPTILSPINSTPPQVPKQIIPFKLITNEPPQGVPVARTVTLPMFVMYCNPDGTYQCKDGPLSTGYELDIKWSAKS